MPSLTSGPLTIVLVFDHAFISGGQSQVAFDSALGLKALGHEPIIFTAVGPVAPVITAAGIRVVCLDQSDLVGNSSKVEAAIQGIWNVKAAEALGRLLASLPRGRSVVHVHGWAKALSPSIAQPIAASGLPAVYTMHEYFLLCPNGGFYNYRRQQACHLDPLSAACWSTNCDSRSYARKIWRNVRQTVMERVADLPRVFADIICISAFQRDTVGHRFPRDARVHLISNPIATTDLGPKPDPVRGDIIFVGRISPEKGPLLFAEAARKLGRTPVFVGDGPLVATLRERYPEAKLLGWQDHDAVRASMRAARALVFPSLWYEGQPLTVLEAKSHGTPVVVSDGCAGRDAIEHDVSGLWFRNGDADNLALALDRLADDATVARLSAGAYEGFWSDPPTIERHARAIERLYAGLVEGTRAGTIAA